MDLHLIQRRRKDMADRLNESCADVVERILRNLISLNHVEDQADALFAAHRALTESDFRHPCGAPLPVPSPVRDGVEFSLSLSTNRTRSLRYIVDILEGKQSLAKHVQVAQRRALAAATILQCDYHRRTISDLFKAAFDDSARVSTSKFVALAGVDSKHDALPVLKLYLNLETGDHSHAVIKACNILRICGLGRSISRLYDIMDCTAREVKMVGVDISAQSDPRVKCYIRRSRHVRSEEAKSIMVRYSNKRLSRIFDAFNAQVLGNRTVYPYKSIQFSCGLNGEDSLDSIRMDARMRRFIIDDSELTRRVEQFLVNMRLDHDYYDKTRHILNQNGRLREGQTLHIIIGLACHNGREKINIYLAPNFVCQYIVGALHPTRRR